MQKVVHQDFYLLFPSSSAEILWLLSAEICVTDALCHAKLMLVLSVVYVCQRPPSYFTTHA